MNFDLDIHAAISWIVGHGISVLIATVILLVIYRLLVPVIHRIVPRILSAQAAALPTGSAEAEELGKRAATLEELLQKLLRVGFLVAIVVVVLAIFELWALVAGIALVIAAVTLASQDVVLDYVMGILILVEGPFYKADWIKVDSMPGVEGEVVEIALRHTMLRDALGGVHSVSNGLIRSSSVLTRVYSMAVVDVQILRAADVDRAITVIRRVCDELAADPEWAERMGDEATDLWVTALTADGVTVRVARRVGAGVHGPVASELRRRLAAAFAAEDIGAVRWDTPLPVRGIAAAKE